MRYLLLILVLPLMSVEAAAPDCDGLKKIAGDLEKMIQAAPKDFHVDCEKRTPESLGLPSDSVGFSGDWDYRCKDLSAIDSQLKSIENEIALLNGIESLKTEIQDGLVTIAKVKSPDQAKTETANFVKNLNVATSLELLMATNTVGKKPVNILSKIIAEKEEWKDLNSFAGLIRKHCSSFPSEGTVCQKDFALTQDTYDEINDFVKIGKGTERKFNASQVKDLKDALSIKKGTTINEDGEKEEVTYSYIQLAQDLKVGPQENGVFADAEFQKIKDFPPLSNSTSYNFLNNLKSSMKVLKESEGLVKAQGIPARFTSFLTELRTRQEWEMKAKLSLVLNQYNDYLPAETKENCDRARNLEKDMIAACLTPLATSKDLKSYEQGAVDDLIAEFEYGQKHITRLDDYIKDCVPDETLTYPEKCNSVLTIQKADLVAKSQVLGALKAKHLQARPDLITFRNFALEQLLSANCMNASESNISCEKDLGNINREAVALSDSASDIIHVLQKPKEATVIDQLCIDTKEVIPYKADLCAIKPDEPIKKSENNDDYEAPVSPDNNGQTGKALFDLAGSALTSIAGIFAPKPVRFNNNPYSGPVMPYNLPPPRDISNQIMDPYVSTGFGNYSATQGVPSYSGGSSGIYSFGTSSHFNSHTGW